MEISLPAIKKSFTTFLQRYHVILFTVIVLGGLAVAVILLNNIVISSSDSSNYTPAGSNATFDEETIERVNQLKSSEEERELLDLSKGRSNPFVE